MKKLGLLVALAMIAGSASANFIATDAYWTQAALNVVDDATGSSVGSTLDSSTDVPGDPGWEFGATVNPVNNAGSYMYGWTEVKIDFGGVAPGDIWDIELQNTSAPGVSSQIFLMAYTSTVRYSSPDSSGLLAPGGTWAYSWDLTGETDLTGIGLWMAGSPAFGGTTISTTVIPEPATFGLVAAFGGAVLFVRKKFMI